MACSRPASRTMLGKTGWAILLALLAGAGTPAVLAELAEGRLRPKIPALREALAPRFRLEHHGLLIAQMLAHIELLEAGSPRLRSTCCCARSPRSWT